MGGNTMTRIGSLCSGYGGLDMAVAEVFGGDVAWFFEYDKAPSKILAHHWPAVPNYGDMTKADWSAIEQVDIICGGTPCQDLSGAGKRAGMTEGTRSNLWVQMREAIALQKPSIVVWENVRGAYSACADSDMGRCPGCVVGSGEHRPFLRALGRVLGDLSSLGYDCRVVPLRGSDVGAAHGRYRVFVVAVLSNAPRWRRGWERITAAIEEAFGGPSAIDRGLVRVSADSGDADSGGERLREHTGTQHLAKKPGRKEVTSLQIRRGLSTPSSAGSDYDSTGRGILEEQDSEPPTGGEESLGGNDDDRLGGRTTPRLGYLTPEQQQRVDAYTAFWDAIEDKHPYFISEEGKDYWPAIQRHQQVLGRPVPPPSIPDGKNGQHRYSPIFGEWMMMLPLGHVTSVPGLSRNDMHKALGNGVIPLQGATATRIGFESFRTLGVAA